MAALHRAAPVAIDAQQSGAEPDRADGIPRRVGQDSVSGRDSRDATIDGVFRDIGAFLVEHHLYPSPANYALIYCVVTEPGSRLAQAVAELTADGLRLSQAQADRLREEFGVQTEGLPAGSDTESLARARQQIENFATIVETTRVETEAYGADLERGASELGRLDRGDPGVAEVVRITGAMITRTRAAEAQLDVAREEASALRQRLAEVQEEARRDPLTRLPNRRAFEDRLAQLIAAGGVASIAICDIDLFKSINDSHGHSVGDRVLKMVADVLATNCGQHMVARIGGEEFVVLFDGLEPAAAASLLEQARTELAARRFRVRGTDDPLGQVTFSAGVARCAEDGEEPPLKRADDLLYKAKKSGRNRIFVEPA